MKLKKIVGIGVLVFMIGAGLSVWLIVDLLTVSEGELKVTPSGLIYSDHSFLFDSWLANCKPDEALPELRQQTFAHQGYQRSFYVSQPSRLAVKPAVLVVLHGSGSSAQQVYSLLGQAFAELSEREGFVVIYADGFGGGWNDMRTKSPHIAKKLNLDDIGYLEAVLDWAAENLGIDANKTFLLGMSNGAQMTMRMLVEAPERVTAATMIGGSLPKNTLYSEKYERLKPLPVMFVNGTADDVVPYQGGQVKLLNFFDFGHVYSVEETVGRWVRAAGYDTEPAISHIDTVVDGTSIELSRWAVSGKSEVRAYRVINGRHTIPMPSQGSKCDQLLSTSHDMNTVEEAWLFFESQVGSSNPSATN